MANRIEEGIAFATRESLYKEIPPPVKERPLILPLEEPADSSTTFSTYAGMAQAYPKLHKAMIDGIANQIITDLKNHQERLKKILKEETV